jgi:hypothetical protein
MKFKAADKTPLQPELEFAKELEAFQDQLNTEQNRLDLKERTQLSLNGHQLLAAGFPTGPKLGSIIKQLKELVLDQPDLNQPDTLLKLAQEILSKEG